MYTVPAKLLLRSSSCHSTLLGKNVLSRNVKYASTLSRNPGRSPKFEDTVYTKEEIANRATNANLLRLVEGYRRYGHYKAELDPLNLRPLQSKVPQLDIAQYGFSEGDMNTKFSNLKGVLNLGKDSATLSEIVQQLEKVYCSKIGVQFNQVESEAEKAWLHSQVESLSSQSLTSEEKRQAYKWISKSESFDHFMQKRFTTTKRYGLEGNEAMMSVVDEIFRKSSSAGVEQIVLGMPHRGRLNLLTGLFKYPPRDLFWKVQGNSEIAPGVLAIGDVLSHIGTSVDLSYGSAKPIHVSLIQNPSHLEAVNPVAMGKVRAKQTNSNDTNRDKAVCVLLHGDAAFAGQGVVTESLALAELPGFTIGGTIHVIVNNQVGFTATSNQGRSSLYSADLAKMIGAPTIHVNSDSIEDVIKATRVATEYRHKFKKDIVLDLIGYRRHGHNEVDEPAFTQPLMYANVRSRPTVAALYRKKLVEEGILTEEEATKIHEDEFQFLDSELKQTANYTFPPPDQFKGNWQGFVQAPTVAPVQTGVDVETLKEIATKSVDRTNITVHQRLEKSHCGARADRIKNGLPVDWATAEAAAFGSLLKEGYNIRLVGQDVGRGTFSQRHVELIDQKTENVHVPLNNIAPNQGKLEVVNSILSELAVLSYEYGYSIEDPKTLPIWEAQFGDFANGAQVAIDQFLISGESKWLKQSGLVMLLPHGFDGTGPEHSSARIERFLQLTDVEGVEVHSKEAFARNPNFYVINPSTPANYFHALRRQMVRNYRKPLVIIGPKILLRHPQALSPLSQMGPGTQFETVFLDTDPNLKADAVERVMFCSGKIYYDLVEERKKNQKYNTAFVRLEELAPFPFEKIAEALSHYKNAKKYYWIQEESQNAGAWSYVEPRFAHFMEQAQTKLQYIGRPPLSASAIGVSSWHKKEAATLMSDAFNK